MSFVASGKAVANQEFVTAHPLEQSDARLHTAAAFQRNQYAIQIKVAAPLSRASEHSEFIRALVDSGDIYHPLSWTPREAHRFLCEVALYEQAGLIVRMPDWWNAKNRPRPRISVTVGAKTPSKLGMDALLDFDVSLTVDGQALSTKEIEALLASSEGLVLIKGKWVEVDRDKLGEVLEQWRDVQKKVENAGVSFGEAMRMLAGAQLDSADSDGASDARPEWSEVIAGKWLEQRLDALRSAQLRSEVDANAGLRTELRPYQKRGVQCTLWVAIRRLVSVAFAHSSTPLEHPRSLLHRYEYPRFPNLADPSRDPLRLMRLRLDHPYPESACCRAPANR